MININNMFYSTKLLITSLYYFYYYLVRNTTLNDLIIYFTLLSYAKNLVQGYLRAKLIGYYYSYFFLVKKN